MANSRQLPQREDFVSEVIDHFVKENNLEGSPVFGVLAEFISEKVLVSEDLWNADPQKTTEGLPAARRILEDSMRITNNLAPFSKLDERDVRPIAEGIFLAVGKYQNRCDFPTWFC